MVERKAFTLVEVLISIALMGIVLVALFSSVDMLRDSNQHLSKQLKTTQKTTQATQVLFKDILSSDGNITITKDEFSRVCIESTANSLYALPRAKVCWVVMKEGNQLVRVEGTEYNLPTSFDDRVEVDRVMENVELFDLYHSNGKVLVVLKEKSKEAIKFMVQGIRQPKVPQKDTKGEGDQIEGQKDDSVIRSNTKTNPVSQPLTIN